MPHNPGQVDRFRGTIMGAGIGDAVGLFTEFLTKARAAQVYGSTPHFSLVQNRSTPQVKLDIHRLQFDLSGWTDDTDQSILILLSFLRLGVVNYLDIAERLMTWVQQGLRCLDRLPLDYGITIGGVTQKSGYAREPFAVAYRWWEEGGRKGAANGAVMRTAFTGALEFKDTKQAVFVGIQVARISHADSRCLASCAIVNALVAECVRGTAALDVDAVIELALAEVQTAGLRLSLPHLQELHAHTEAGVRLADLNLDDGASMGYTFKALGAGVYALRSLLQDVSTSSFTRIIEEITMEAGDADTNATVAGAMMGALLGHEALPSDWKLGLHKGDWLLGKADKACIRLGIAPDGQTYDSKKDVDLMADGGRGWLSAKEKRDKELALQERINAMLNAAAERNRHVVDDS